MREHFAAFLSWPFLAFAGLCCTHKLTYKVMGHITFFPRVIFPNISVMELSSWGLFRVYLDIFTLLVLFDTFNNNTERNAVKTWK